MKAIAEFAWSMGSIQIFGTLLRSTGPRHAYSIFQETHLPEKRVYLSLKRMESRGLIEGESERRRMDNRPARRFYKLTPEGLSYGDRLREHLLSTVAKSA